MSEQQCQLFTVTGRVQGVGFRAATLDRARALGVCGWVRNHPQGHVETLVCGDADQLERMAAWLEQGPGSARVTQVESRSTDVSPPAGFEIR